MDTETNEYNSQQNNNDIEYNKDNELQIPSGNN